MKFIAILLIAFYLFLPVACLAHPCGLQGELPHQEAADITASEQSGESPHNDEPDNCESTCCCAAYLPFSPSLAIPSPRLTSMGLPAEPRLVLPRLIDRIFIPPQNLF